MDSKGNDTQKKKTPMEWEKIFAKWQKINFQRLINPTTLTTQQQQETKKPISKIRRQPK